MKTNFCEINIMQEKIGLKFVSLQKGNQASVIRGLFVCFVRLF